MISRRWPILVLVVTLAAAGCGPKKSAGAPAKELDTPGRIRLAQSYFGAGRVPEAFEVVREAIAKDPDNAGLRNYYGQLCLLAGRLPEAREALLEALRLDPYLTDAHNNLGVVLDRMGRPNDAEQEFKKALQDPAYPTPEKVYLNLGVLYDAQGRLDEALSALRKAVEIDPKYYQAHYELAGLLDRLGKLEEAAREYEVAAPGYRNQGVYQYRLGFTYFRLGDRVKAREHLNKVVEISPGSESAAQAAEILRTMD